MEERPHSSRSSHNSQNLERKKHSHDEREESSYHRDSKRRREDQFPTIKNVATEKNIEEISERKQRDISEIEWKEHKELLDWIFFKKNDLIQKDSPEYEEFWEFLEKYIQFKKQKNARKSQATGEEDNTGALKSTLGLPSRYDDRYLVNFTVVTDHQRPEVVRKIQQQLDSKDGLSETEITEFRKIIHLHHNFCQKRQFNKLVKIKQDRKNLPIYKYRDEILNAVKSNQVIIVAGDTGCGKSTQLPQYLLEAGYNKIACTQPRRIATMSLCRRVAYETMNEYGSQIAYQIRFDSSRTRESRIIFLTEGLLLRQLVNDSLLTRYDVLIVDEVHERHIHCDFLLGIIKSIVKKRADLKIVLMSATININLFSEYFEKAPIILVPGRIYPIEVQYIPLEDERDREKEIQKEEKEKDSRVIKKSRIDVRPYLRILERIDQQFPPNERGDLLIFVSGIDEILTLAEEMKKYAAQTKSWIILMLHSSLSVEEQDKVFDIAPEGVRKCIISTNIAETSVTIDGIRFCVDSGKVKEMGWDSETKIQRLQEFWISKASAEQRKGRAGRTGPGHCFRFYSEPDYNHFMNYPVPEIQRIPLESIILQIKALNLVDPREFPFIERPSTESIEESIEALKRLEALDSDLHESVTPLGGVLSKLPVDVKIGKLLVLGTIFDVLEPILTVSAALSVQTPFLRTSSEDAIIARNKFTSDHGDSFTVLNAYDEWIYLKVNTRDNTRKWCRRHGIEEQRLYEISKLRDQFKELLIDCGLIAKDDDSDNESQKYWKSKLSKTNYYGHKTSSSKPFEKNSAIRKKKNQLRMLQMQRHTRGRKILSMDDEFQNSDDKGEEKEEEEIDLRDIDFKLSHSLDELNESVSKNLSRKQLNLIKLILTSGLYPNIAIPDEFNANHKESEQVYHTQFKQFASIHPSSVFSGRSVFIAANDVLCYEKLLETNKPYITNAYRIQSLHALLLFARNIDTNRDCDRFVVDNWLEIRLKKGSLGEFSVTTIHQLRLLMRNILYRQLKQSKSKKAGKAEEEDPIEIESIPQIPETTETSQDPNPFRLPEYILKIQLQSKQYTILCTEDELSRKLAEFLEWPIEYSLSKIKQSQLYAMFGQAKPQTIAADKEHAQDKEQQEQEGESMDAMQQLEVAQTTQTESFDSLKGGVKINSWLRYGSILEENQQPITAGFSKYMKKQFHCTICKRDFKFNIDEILEHTELCKVQHKDSLDPSVIQHEEVATPTVLNVTESKLEGSKALFFCDTCQKQYHFSATEILKHKRTHAT